MKLFLLFTALLVLQRLSELLVARKNESRVRHEGAIEYDRGGYKYIVAMHVAFFVSLISEYFFLGRSLSSHWPIPFAILIAAQVLRYWAIASLGKYWNTKVLVVPGAPLINKGPYQYIRHPNYLAVVIEIAVIPLVFSCYITSVLFSILNLMVLRRRIGIEDSALSKALIRN
jgi:methyltransferase